MKIISALAAVFCCSGALASTQLIEYRGITVTTESPITVFDSYHLSTYSGGFSVFKAVLDLNKRALEDFRLDIDLTQFRQDYPTEYWLSSVTIGVGTETSSYIAPHSILFSYPQAKLISDHAVFSNSAGGYSLNYSIRGQETGSLSFSAPKNPGGFGLMPAPAGSDCASFSCMVPFQVPARLAMTIVVNPPVPEPETYALALAGGLLVASKRLVRRKRPAGAVRVAV